jgi:hypothetical protein
MSAQEYPMHGYLYNPDGTHGPPTILRNREELWTFLGVFGNIALTHGMRFLIVSGDDEDCYCEIDEGVVRYASGVNPQEFTERLQQYAGRILSSLPAKEE